ncbi:MAG: glycosyltransferase family 4 protein [Verrucomicrobia bacterium]|nr:glycosyltransferase family 4 protein [Verrucomicrobiota bacterium]MCH8511533.1 glycosyltransferase family 4 protein [Kiritimatiellia bacterium]
MKILVISDYRDAISAKSEVAFLIGIHKSGAEVEVMTYPDCLLSDEFRAAGIRVIEFHPRGKWSRDESEEIRKLLQEGKHDLLHLFNSKAICTGLRAADGLPVKVVLYRGYVGNVHCLNVWDYTKFLHPRVDGIMCIAKAVEEHLQKHCVFVKPMIRTISKGHRLEWYDDVRPLPREALSVPESAFLLSTVANTRRMKGMPYLIRAMLLLPEEANIHLVLVGKGLDSGEVRRLLKETPHPERIHFMGYRTDGWRIVKASDAFVLPSIYGEAITKSAIEAMSLGIAPIMTRIPGNRDLVRHEISGLMVPRKDPRALAEAIMRFYRDPELRARCGYEARERIRNEYHTEQTTEDLLKFYGELMQVQGA